MPATLVYRSRWSPIRPLVYTDDSRDDAANRLIDTIFRIKTNRLTIENNKYYYRPSDEYKKFVVRMKKIK